MRNLNLAGLAVAMGPSRPALVSALHDSAGWVPTPWRPSWSAGPSPGLRRPRSAAAAAPTDDVSTIGERIYELAGGEFDIGKPSVLAKVLYGEVGVHDPYADKQKAGRSRPKPASQATLKLVLESEPDPKKQELVALVLRWLKAKAKAKRGGFIPTGPESLAAPGWASALIPDGRDLPADPSASPVLLVDATHLLFRSFFAMPKLTAPDGLPVGALVGFCNTLNKLAVRPWAEEGLEQRVVMVFDSPGDTFRHALYPTYKQHRKEAPSDIRAQFDMAHEACAAYGLDVVDAGEFEADDAIASLALQAVASGVTNVTIASNDKDLAQLVTRRVHLLDSRTDTLVGPEEVLEKYLVPPGRVADLLAISGDQSDGIRGVKGYGPVTAAKVLAKHSTLDGAVGEMAAALAAKGADAASVEAMAADVSLAKKLTTLRTDMELPPLLAAAEQGGGEGKGGGELQGGREGVQSFRVGNPGRVLDFLRGYGLEDLAGRTAKLLGVAAARRLPQKAAGPGRASCS